MTTQVLDQSSNSGAVASSAGPEVNGNQAIAQTFQAGISGVLRAVALAVTCKQGAKTLRPRISVHAVVDGKLSQSLGDVTASTRNIAWPAQVTFASGIPQVSGERYAIVVTYPDARSSDRFRWSGSATNNDETQTSLTGVASEGGWSWSSQSGACDFQTYVSDSSSTDESLGPIVRGDGVVPGQG
jgi:hypothetical protein